MRDETKTVKAPIKYLPNSDLLVTYSGKKFQLVLLLEKLISWLLYRERWLHRKFSSL